MIFLIGELPSKQQGCEVVKTAHQLKWAQEQAALHLKESASIFASAMGHLNDAYQHAKDAKELSPTWSEPYYRMGIVLQAQGKFKKAIKGKIEELVQVQFF